MKKKTIILTSVLAIAVCVALVVGTTVALSTGDASINISFSTGKVSLEANVSNIELYSAHLAANGELTDERGNTYNYKKCNNKFANGGTATFNDDGTLVMSAMSPGDKIQFKVKLTNTSTVQIVYKVGLALLKQESSEFFNALNFSAAVATANGYRQLNVKSDVKDKTSEEVSLGVADGVAEENELLVSIELPISAQNVQYTTIDIRCFVYAVQDTQAIHGVAIIERNGEYIDCDTLQKAVDLAKENETIYLVRDSEQSVGDVKINKSVTIASYNDAIYKFPDARISITDENAKVELSYMEFVGNSYLDISNANVVSVHNCIINATPEKVTDATTMQPLEKSAFIVSMRGQLLNTQITVENNVFMANADPDFVPVYLKSAVANGSCFVNNTFGSQESPLLAQAIELTAASGATVRFEKNTFFTDKAISLLSASATSQFAAVLSQNAIVASGTPLLVTVGANAAIDVYDTGSLANGGAVKFDNFDVTNNSRFCGINIQFFADSVDGGLKVLQGDILLCGTYTEQQFRDNYVVTGSNTSLRFESASR